MNALSLPILLTLLAGTACGASPKTLRTDSSSSAPPPLSVAAPSPTRTALALGRHEQGPGDKARLRDQKRAPTCPSEGPRAVTLPERITLGTFWRALEDQVSALDLSALEPAYAAFANRHGVDPATPGLQRDFTRLWVAFEATRDGGWWRLRWDITDQEPSSIKIWKAWLKSPPQSAFATPSAVAECDEITALFSVTARRLGVQGVGLFYPTWNHVIAGWTPQSLTQPGTKAPVVLVPTTQIFQGCSATFDETTFATPKHVYEYPRTDISDHTPLPTPVAAFLLEQVRIYGEASPALLGLIRAKRAELLGSSLGNCSAYRKQLANELTGKLSCADERALRHVAATELRIESSGTAEPHATDTLAWLASGH